MIINISGKKRAFSCQILLYLFFTLNILAQQPLRVMPLGNSITFDTYENDPRTDAYKISYRYKLYQLFSESGFYVDFVGSRRAGWYYFSDCENAGWPGIRDHELANIIQTGNAGGNFGKITDGPYLNYYPADVILLEIGTNDVIANDYNTVTDVNRLLDAVDSYEQLSGKPVLVVLASIISLQNYPCSTETRVIKYNSLLKAMAQTRINNGDKLIFVDMECAAGINYYTDMIDWLHPNEAGYNKMAALWHNTLASLNARPVVSNIPDQSVSEGNAFAKIYLDNYVTDSDDPDADITWYISPENPQFLNVTIDANRVATISVKNSDWNGSETITFIAADKGRIVPSLRRYSSDQVTFTVTPVNDPPVILSQKSNLSVPEDSPINISIDYLNIQDVDNQPGDLTLNVLSGTNYTFSGNQVMPAHNFHGNLYVNVVVNDLVSQSNVFQVLVNVIPVNDPPVIVLPASRNAITGRLYDETITITDVDGEENLILTPLTMPSWCSFISQTGRLFGTPQNTDLGDNLFKFRGSDGIEYVDSSFIITVQQGNNKPLIQTTPVNVAYVGLPYNYELKATDLDAGDILQLFTVKVPSWLQFFSGNGLLAGNPDYSLIGSYDISLGVTDGKDSTLQNFILEVKEQSSLNDFVTTPPLIYPNPFKDYLNVHLPENQQVYSIEIYNSTGYLVLSKALEHQQSSCEVKLENLYFVPGIYYCMIKGKDTIFKSKIICQ